MADNNNNEESMKDKLKKMEEQENKEKEKKQEKKEKDKQRAQILENLEKELEEERKQWNQMINDLSVRIKDELKKVLQLEAESVSKRQELTELIANYSYEMNRLLPTIKKKKKDLFEYYASKYQLKTNTSEKNKLIDADMAYVEAKLESYDNHITFLVESRKSMDHIIWSVKNKIELYKITEMEG